MQDNRHVFEYKFVLLQKCNIFHPPIIPKPMMRIVGFARTQEEADAIKNRILNHKGAKYIPLFIEPVQCLQMIGLSPRRHLDLDCVKRKKDFVFDAHESWSRKRTELHEKRMVSDKKSLDFGISIEHRNNVLKMQHDLQDAFPPPENMEDVLFEINHYSGNEDSDVIEKHIIKKTSSKSSSSSFQGDYEKTFSMDESSMTPEEWSEMNYCLQIWPNELIIADQHWVSVTIIPDFSVVASNWIEATACGNEPFYIIHTAAQSSEEMTEITKNKIWNNYSDADTYTHPMYKWMDFSTIFDENISTSYMDPALDKIMTGHQKEKQIVSKFEKLKTVKKTDLTKVKSSSATTLELLNPEEFKIQRKQDESAIAAVSKEAAVHSKEAVVHSKEDIEKETRIIKMLHKAVEDQSNKSIDDILDELEKKDV